MNDDERFLESRQAVVTGSPAGKVLVYVPHGGIPDRRGFSPAIVACEFAKRTRALRPSLVCAQEDDAAGPAHWGEFPLERLAPRRLYTRLRKLGLTPPGQTLPRRFLAKCRQMRPDLLHVHQLEFDVREFGRRHRHPLPVILHAHVLSQRPHARHGLAQWYVAVSDHVVTGLRDMGYPADRIVMIRNGVDTGLFAPASVPVVAAAKERLGAVPSAPVLAFVGRKHDIKGYPAFLAVAERLLADREDLHVLAIGANPERPSGESGYMASRARESRLAAHPRFQLFPAMTQADLARLYPAIDVTLLPSLAEPQGMVMIESLAAGCVTISSRVGGVSETITDGATGYLMDDPLDVEALIHRTAAVLDRLSELKPLRAAARAFALTHLDWSVSAARLDDLYRKTVSC